MSAVDHGSYSEELDRCNYTLEYIEKSLAITTEKKERLDNEVERLKRHFDSQSSQDYLDLTVNSLLQGSANLKLRNLLTARGKPYFARVDFKEEGKEASEQLYIGKMSLMRDEDQQVIIIDWRAPIANLYYEGRLGSAQYVCPDGNILGQLMLKRQFSINNGILQEIFDIDITTNDDFLQSYLGASANNRLKEIVSTIQAEQNSIIRADMWTPLIVQGAAGSGKTTIALHRIAYLLYVYDKAFEPENFMIIAPTRFFLNYISEVLPELGVERVRQSTFEEIATEIIGKKFKIRDPYEKLMVFVNNNSQDNEGKKNKLLKKVSEIKASMVFKEALDKYISRVEESYIPKENFKIGKMTLFTYNEINTLFLNEYKRLPIEKRLNEIKKHLNNRLKVRKDQLINQLHDDCDKEIMSLKMSMEDGEERQSCIIKAIDYKNNTIKDIEGYAKKAIKEYMGRITNISPYKHYKDFINDSEGFIEIMEPMIGRELASFLCSYTAGVLSSGSIEIEDFAPMIYLKYRISGLDEKITVRHIVIDEAQDFSVFQLYVLKNIIKDSSFTILGDLCQGIHSYRGIKDWKDVERDVFENRRCGFLTLEQSYRTTVEIMDAANIVIRKLKDKNMIEAKPVIRHGSPVLISMKKDDREISDCISLNIKELKNDGIQSIAIICKTVDECQTLLASLRKNTEEPYIITGKDEEYKSGVVIVPSYLVKGLEFDAVIITNACTEHYSENELDAKLLYVAMTRALHKLYIYHTGDLSPLLT